MNVVTSFQRQAKGVALVEMSLPKDDRLLGGDPLPDWRLAIERAAGELGVKVGIRNVERGYKVAFQSQEQCEQVMRAAEPLWNMWLLKHLNVAAWALYRETGEQAVEELARDYGLTYADFSEFIEQAVARQKRNPMTDEYISRHKERMQQPYVDGTYCLQDRGREENDGQDLTL